MFSADIDLRRTFLSHIVLAGGTTLFPGFGDRLLSEVRKGVEKQLNSSLEETQNIKIRIAAPPNRTLMTWIGGSILASLAAFQPMWVSREDYDECGASAVTNVV